HRSAGAAGPGRIDLLMRPIMPALWPVGARDQTWSPTTSPGTRCPAPAHFFLERRDVLGVDSPTELVAWTLEGSQGCVKHACRTPTWYVDDLAGGPSLDKAGCGVGGPSGCEE